MTEDRSNKKPYPRLAHLEDSDTDIQLYSPKVTVLVVDDSPESLIALEALLAGPDRHIVKMASGQAALRYLLGHDVALILLDVKMSGLSGYETAALIRKRARTRNVPIIFLTAYEKDDADVARGYSCGAASYMFKPIIPGMLQSKVNCFVELAKETDELKRHNEELERLESELIETKPAQILVKHAPAPLFVVNSSGTILAVNDAAAESLALKKGELLEQCVSYTLNVEERWRFLATLREVTERGVPRELTFKKADTDGQELLMTLDASPLRDEVDRVIGVIGLLRDMHTFQRMEAELDQRRADLKHMTRDLDAFKDIVLTRDLMVQALEKDLEKLRQELKGLRRQAE